MTSFKAIIGLSLAASTCLVLIACNKSGNDNQPPAAQPLAQPLPPAQPAFVPGPLGPAQGGVPRVIVKPQQFNYVRCYTSILDYGSAKMPYMIPQYDIPFDSAKLTTQEVPYLYSTMLGKVTLNVQPETLDASGALTSAGYLELTLAGTAGTGNSTLRGNLDAHLNLEIDDQQQQKNFKVDCSLETVQDGVPTSMIYTGNVKDSYSCSNTLPQVASAQATPPTSPIPNNADSAFTTKSKARVIIENATQSLVLSNGKERESGYIVVSDERKSAGRNIRWSVRYGQAFMLNTGGGTATANSLLCRPAPNATQQK